jgi:hypothetical protein
MKKSLVISLIFLFSIAIASPVLAFETNKEKVKTEQVAKEGEKKACCAKKKDCEKTCTEKKECPKKKECAEKKPCCKKK